MSAAKSILLAPIAWLLAGAGPVAHAQMTLYVDDTAIGVNDCSSWSDACAHLQDALAAAEASGGTVLEIRVAQGTYRPDRDWAFPSGSGGRDETFRLLDGVAVRGGYAGFGAVDPDERDPARYETILSGDLEGDDSGELDDPSRNENSYHVVSASNTDATAVLDGLLVTGGHADGDPDKDQDCGGGIFIVTGSPTITNCVIRHNAAMSDDYDAYGGGIYSSGGSPTLTDCAIAENLAYNSQWYAYGGGMYSASGTPVLTRCAFIANTARNPDHRAYGGGLYKARDGLRMTDCTFTGNMALTHDGLASGGAMYNYMASSAIVGCTFTANVAHALGARAYGGGMYNSNASPTLVGCRFNGNTASGSSRAYGGGLYNYSTGRPSLVNCSFTGNSAVRGGAVYNAYNSAPTLTNCTLVGNTATECGGFYTDDSIAVLTNCVLWANGGSTESAQLDVDDGRTFVHFSCIQGLTGLLGGAGNIGDDPLLADADGPDDVLGTDDDDVHLLSGSPCIDAGNSSADLDALRRNRQPIPSTDLQGSPRFIDMIEVPDTGVGTFPIVDMGVFEHADDCNGNGRADDVDIATGYSEDCNANGIPEECEVDCNQNGIPDACEPDCNGNGIPDDCDVVAHTSPDCNNNMVPDSCDIDDGTSGDCTGNGVPDECEVDCNRNGIADSCDLAYLTSEDCNQDGVPDECLTSRTDCNHNGLVDQCETDDGVTPDANGNGLPDECEPRVLFVDQRATGHSNGTGWEDAFTDLQDALSVAAASAGFVEEVWVAEGVFRPVGAGGPRTATFHLISGVGLYGGFAGYERSRNQRDANACETVLGGDLCEDDEPDPLSDCCAPSESPSCDDESCAITVCAESPECCTEGWGEECARLAVISCCDTCRRACDNAYHVVTGSNTDETAILEGFTIRNGYANGDDDDDRGAGMLAANGSPTVHNCTFVDNSAQYGGGGLYVAGNDVNPAVIGCTFAGNVAGSGGGVMNYFRSSPMFVDCTFTGNSGGSGGGMFNLACTPELSNCVFHRNIAGTGGGMLNLTHDGTTLANCTFSGNRADFGGGVYNLCCTAPLLRSCLFTGNVALFSGGGMRDDFSFYGVDVVNTTFAYNSAGVSGGAVFTSHSDELAFANSILWGNEDGGPADESAQIHIDDSVVNVHDCCVQGWTGQLGGTGNMPDNPRFVDADGVDDTPGTEDDNPRLSVGSPCIDAGDPDFVPEPGETDLDGHARVLCGRVDLGAFESGIGDYECDGDLDLGDHAAWCKCMTGPDAVSYDPGCEAFDFQLDGDVDMQDLEIFQRWFTGPR